MEGLLSTGPTRLVYHAYNVSEVYIGYKIHNLCTQLFQPPAAVATSW